MKRLAILTTHPIQYYAPLFRLMAGRGRIEIKVFYTWGEASMSAVYDPGFGQQRQWDIPLLQGYAYEFVQNTSKKPGSSHFKGIVNPSIIRQIDAYNPDAVLVFGWAFQSHLKVLRHYKGKKPVFFRGDSTLLDEPPGFHLKKFIRRTFLRWVYRHIDIAFYVGQNNKAYYKAHGLSEKQLVYAPHAIDNQRFQNDSHAQEEKAAEWRRDIGIPEGLITVLFAGKLEPKKNPMWMVAAAKRLPSMHFIVVGNGPLEQAMKQEATACTNITFLPFQNQSVMPLVYRLSDVFVLPSNGPGETWGLAINEAMACGRAVIATDRCGGAADLIKNGENGFVIAPKLEAFISGLAYIGDHPTFIKSAGASSAAIIGHFTFSHIAQAIEDTLLSYNQ